MKLASDASLTPVLGTIEFDLDEDQDLQRVGSEDDITAGSSRQIEAEYELSSGSQNSRSDILVDVVMVCTRSTGKLGGLASPNILDTIINEDFGTIGEDYMKTTFSINSTGNKFRASFTLPPEKDNVTMISYSYVDLSETNRRLGTNYSNKKRILGFSSDSIVSAGKVNRKVKLKPSPVAGSGKTSNNSGHDHEYTLDASLSGTALEACSPDGTCHTHKIVKGTVLPATGATGRHSHSLPVSTGSRRSIPNIKIKDLAAVRKLSRIDASLVPASSEQLSNPLMEFGVSRDKNGDASFIFDFSVEDALRHSVLGSIFSRPLTASVKRDILSNARIIDLKVQRTRRDVVSGPVATVVTATQKLAGSSLERNIRKHRDGEAMDAIKTGMISERETGSEELRTFSGKDYSFPLRGEHEYTVKILLADAVVIYLRKKMSGLEGALTIAGRWLSELSVFTYSDQSSMSFSSAGSRAISRKYRDGNTPIEMALAIYAEIAGDIFGVSSASNIINIMYPMINSVTGSYSGTISVMSAMESLLNKMHNLLGQHIASGQTSTEQGVSPGFGGLEKGVLEFKKTFSNTLKVSTPPGHGYGFATGDSSADGVNTLTRKAYDRLAKEEVDKFSNNLKADTPSEFNDANISKTKINALTNLKTTMPFYFTPSSIGTATGEVLNLSTMADKWNEGLSTEAVSKLRASEYESSTSNSSLSGLLGEIGITCEFFSNKNRRKSSHEAGTFFVDSVDDGALFLPTDGFASKNISIELESDFDKDTEETNRIISALFPVLVASEKGPQRSLNLNLFDVSSKDNKIKSMTPRELKALPAQIKSLVLSRSNSISQNWLDGEVFNESLFDTVYNSIVEVQTLSYKKDSNGNRTISEWSPLSSAELRQAAKRPLRCRIVKYSNARLGIEQKEDLNAPILSSQFIISDLKVSKSRRSSNNSTAQQKNQEIKRLNNIIRNDTGTAGSPVATQARTSISTGRTPARRPGRGRMTGGGY